MYAFATKTGIERLLGVPNISRLLTHGGRYHLVVGVDAITNGDALLTLEEAVLHFRGRLTAHAFLHDYPGTFHPKFSWFRTLTHLAIVTGSGNLTMSGLGVLAAGPPPIGNWEAFSTQSLRGVAAAEALAMINNWIEQSLRIGQLRSITDPEVRDQAMANSRVRITTPATPRRRPVNAAAGIPVPPIVPVVAPVDMDDVFIRELPQTRPGQADIGRRGLGFLGFRGATTNVFLQHVELDNTVGPTVEQRLFVNSSQNYRVEMPPIARHGYDVDANDNRMILVAVRLNDRSFRYTIVPVSDPEYAKVSAILGPVARQGHGRPMRLRETSTDALRQLWPTAPENLLPVLGYAIDT